MANELTYHSAANTGDTLYVHLENTVGQLWNGSTFEAPVSGNWANYDIAMTEQGTSTGIFRASMPAAAAGQYCFVVRKQAGGSPAVTDIVLGSSPLFMWSGSAIRSPGVPKNAALSNFEFLMIDSTDHVTGKTGLTVTAQRSIDGAAFASCANSVTPLSDGVYKINLAAADLNGDVITLKFTAAGADARLITIITQP